MKKHIPLLPVLLLVLALLGQRVGMAGNVDDKDIDKLIRLLAHGTHFKVRVQSAKALGLLKSEAAVKPLIRALRNDPDHLVRGTAAWALGAIAHPLADEALTDAISNEESFVVKQALRARKHVRTKFPTSLQAFKVQRYHLHLTEVTDTITPMGELAANFQEAVAVHFVNNPRVDLGDDVMDMDDEEEGSKKSKLKVLQLHVVGSIAEIIAPPDRSAGQVTVAIMMQVQLRPLGWDVIPSTRFEGTVDFAGGAKPASPLDDDPLLEAQIKAVTAAAKKGAVQLEQTLGLTVVVAE